MNFSEEEIQLAKDLRKLGLAWEPKAGHLIAAPNHIASGADERVIRNVPHSLAQAPHTHYPGKLRR